MLAITSLRDPEAPGPTIYVSMTIDSGANVSLLAKENLRDLGIKQRGAQAEIERDRAPALAVKSQFPLEAANWTPWGPTFDLDLRFAHGVPGLAGRRDFFRSFVVTFVEDTEAPSYILTQR
jgi:hypothetical protein